MLDFCVAIRAYNAERYLPEILNALRSQEQLEGYQWEVLIVDNNSVDRTAQIVKEFQAEWMSDVPLRYCLELRQGSSYARRRAIEEANAPLIGFLDDDNIPAKDWIRAAINFAQHHPKAGAFGGQIHGDFEVPPPDGFKEIAVYFALVERKQSLCFTEGRYDKINMLPPGAGIVIRRQVWMSSVPSELKLSGPVGKSLAKKGEDIEALSYIKRAGWEIWFNADMHIYHKIPRTRFENEYMMAFFREIGLSKVYIRRALTFSSWQWPARKLTYISNDFRKMILFLLRNNFGIRENIVSKCELKLLWCTFLSNFISFS